MKISVAKQPGSDTPVRKPETLSTSDLLAKLKTKPAQVSPSDESRLLHGSGLTKKLAEKAAKEHAAIQAQDSHLDQTGSNAPVIRLDVAALPSTMMDDNIQLDQYQQSAVDHLSRQQFGVLIGKAGTGKTTTSKATISAIEKHAPTIDLNQCRLTNDQKSLPDFNVAMCIVSVTGRAVQQIKRALPAKYHPLCNTIHATLGYSPVDEEYFDKEKDEWRMRKIFRPTFTASNPLPFKICVIDETGMVPIYLFNELVAALPSDCRIIMMGDINQLPPVIGKSVLGFAMLQWPTFELSHLHRNAGVIAENAHRILEGRWPKTDPAKFAMIELPSGGFESQKMIQAVIQKLHKNGTFDPMRDGLIVPQNVGTIGQEALNSKLVHYFNPTRKLDGVPVNPRIIITAGYNHLTYAVGDKIMLLHNDRKRGLTNGMVGVIESITPNQKYRGEAIADQAIANLSADDFDLDDLHDSLQTEEKSATEEIEEQERQASHVTTVRFQNCDEPVSLASAGDYGRITLAYAFTCHKSQGGEYPTVVVVCHSTNAVMLTREWLYTAVTRSQDRVILLYNRLGLMKALNRQAIVGNTLEEKAKAFLALQDRKDISLPNLAEPKTLD